MTMTVSDKLSEQLVCVTFICSLSVLVSAPIITTSNISAVVVDGQSINFTCNVTTPVNGVDVMWLDGNGTANFVNPSVIDTLQGLRHLNVS